MSITTRFLAPLFSSTHFRRYQPHLNKINQLARKTARFCTFTVEDRSSQGLARLRRTLTISRGSFAIFVERPMSLWIVAITLAIVAAAPLMRRFQPTAA
jgi:hypothetical protein